MLFLVRWALALALTLALALALLVVVELALDGVESENVKSTLAEGRFDMRELRRLARPAEGKGDVGMGMSRPRPAPAPRPPMISMLSRFVATLEVRTCRLRRLE